MGLFVKHIRYIIIITLSILLSACGDDKTVEDPEPPTVIDVSSRTVLVYMVSDNSLGSSGFDTADIYEMLAGKKYIGAGDHLILYVDGFSTKPRIYDITSNTTATTLSELTPVKAYDEEINSCTYEQFSSVLQFMRRNYPSDSYGLILWSHASGWIPPYASTGDNSGAYGAKTRSFGQDQHVDDASRQTSLTINELRDAILDFGRLDFLMFDACFMQNIEVLYQLRDAARYIIASPAEIPGPGAPYHAIMSALFADENYAEGIVKGYYNYYANNAQYGVLLSAIDTERLHAFAEATRPYVLQYKQALMSMSYTDVLDYFLFDTYYSRSRYADFYDMMSVMQHALSEEDYADWMAEYDKIFVTSAHTNRWYTAVMGGKYMTVDSSQYSGVSMHIPLKKYADKNAWFASAYYDTDWANAVWIE